MKKLYTALFIASLMLLGSSASALDLTKQFSIPLKKKARVLGETSDHFAIYNRPNLTIYNSRGKQIYKKSLKNNVKPSLSPDGRILALVTYADRSPTSLKTVKLSLYNQAGKFKWKLDNPPANSYTITNQGMIFGLEGIEGMGGSRMHIYDQYGDRLNILNLKAMHGLEISPSGAKFIIDQARAGLLVYDSLGEKLASIPVSSQYKFDQDDRYLGAFFQGKFSLYQDEKLVKTISTKELSIVDFEMNVAENILVVMSNKWLEIFDLITGDQKWQYRLLEEQQWYSSLSLSADGKFISTGIDYNLGNSVAKDKRHVKGIVDLFRADGKNMIRHQETYELWGMHLPRGVFSTSGGSLIVTTREVIKKLRIK